MPISLKPADECDFDVATLGEVTVRLSPPGHGRIEYAASLEVHVGGGEYNVAYALLEGRTPQEAVTLGTAHGALLQTTRGDTSQVNLSELEHLAAGGTARIKR